MSERTHVFPSLPFRAAAKLLVTLADVATSANSFRGGSGGSIHGSGACGFSGLQR
jgi:hypothetical protein